MSTKKAKAKTVSWTTLKKRVREEESEDLILILKKLYDLTPENKALIRAFYYPGEVDAELFEKCRTKVVNQFFPSRGCGKLKLGEAKKAIRDFHKVTSNIQGTAELMMTFVEQGVLFTNTYGDIDERFYTGVENVLEDLSKLIQKEGYDFYLGFKERLEQVDKDTEDIGWGFHDSVAGILYELEEGLSR